MEDSIYMLFRIINRLFVAILRIRILPYQKSARLPDLNTPIKTLFIWTKMVSIGSLQANGYNYIGSSVIDPYVPEICPI